MKIYILAGTYQQAAHFASLLGLPRSIWKFVNRPEDLHAITRILVIRLETASEHVQYAAIYETLNVLHKAKRAQVCEVSLDALVGIERPKR